MRMEMALAVVLVLLHRNHAPDTISGTATHLNFQTVLTDKIQGGSGSHDVSTNGIIHRIGD